MNYDKKKPIVYNGKKDYMKIKRGMVFQYNINPNVDKMNNPQVKVDGRMYRDCRQYGTRDWLVVSCDENNYSSWTCNVVPITASAKTKIPTHVDFVYNGTSLTVLCEGSMTVNIVEITNNYRYTLRDDVMDRVDEALAIQFGISKKRMYIDGESVEDAFGKIESIIEGIVRNKVAQISKKRASTLDVEDAILRIGTGLEELFNNDNNETVNVGDDNVKTEDDIEEIETDRTDSIDNYNVDEECNEDDEISNDEEECTEIDDDKKDITEKLEVVESEVPTHIEESKSQIEKFYNRYPNMKPKSEEKEEKEEKKETKEGGEKKKRKRREWTTGSMKQFLKDIEEMTPLDCAKKWEFDTVQNMYKTKYYVQVKISKCKL